MSETTTRKRPRREPVIWVEHHVYPRPEEVRQEDVLRAGRLIHELLHRDQQEIAA